MTPGPGADPRPVDPVVIETASVVFGDVHAVRQLSLEVRVRTILGVIGPSGAGKTTTIRLLTGAIRPRIGRVRVLGEDPARFQNAARARIGYMPQHFALYPVLSTQENLDFAAGLYGMGLRHRRRRIPELLHLFELWEARSRRAQDLSGGMQRRLSLAAAMVHDPELLLLDEPTTGLDPLLRDTIWRELHRLRDAGRTILVTTQYVVEAEECDVVVLIDGGRVIAHAPPAELRRAAASGDVIEVVTSEPFDASALRALDGVRGVRLVSPGTMRLTVADAGPATPAIVDAVERAGGRVRSIHEVHLSFDEVFVELVRRHDAEMAEATA